MVDRLDQQARRQALSDLMDGAVDAGGAARACAAWREDGASRADWYAYHLIGDVLRSDDLAHRPLRDEAFLASLRSRLASEPVVLAPQPAPPSAPRQEAPRRVANGASVGRRSLWRRAWAAPSAVAAGFMAVAGVLVVTRVAEVPVSPSSSVIAGGTAVPGVGTPGIQPVSTVSQPLVAASPAPVAVPVANGKLIRDARLDQYLAAHKQYGGSVLAMPVVSVRSAAPAAPDR
ncbi:sigma-E factor negative regulatory protein [Aquincola sp. J276]|uniref:sigma-E factor negative regulatory protein n=1 Tax=Aquincola sp. J276 TaxID=2898432 RepID=UPI00215127F5|nr:sigma-E factor negative regulatory protein [Aquincola sp. J276]MCR5866991.1 sigma-E factor negative regulatory protein [Aquincola sp. J276]